MKSLHRTGRSLRTLRHLRPRQVAQRVKLRSQKALYGLIGQHSEHLHRGRAPGRYGWPEGHRTLDAEEETGGHPSIELNLRGVFELLNQRVDLGHPINWNPAEASQLWRYHLHYFDWAWDLLVHPNRDMAVEAFSDLYRSWRNATVVGRWDAWSPYVVSVRSWTLCGIFEKVIRGGPIEEQVVCDLATHASYLRANIEFDVGGNHLIKNLKALVGLGMLLRRDGLVRWSLERLSRQVNRQILSDGGHFERSPSYHAQVMGDFVDVAELLRAAGVRTERTGGLDSAVAAMRRWLALMLMPDGTVPLLNDCVPVPVPRLNALGVAPERGRGVMLLEDSGYAILKHQGHNWHGVLDVGPPCPADLPAHAQADPLHLVLHVDGQPVIVDTGTSTYAPGRRRQYERSTAAHNTIEIGGEDATEVYGGFRAGRRHHVTIESVSSRGVTASHDGYRHLTGSPTHVREVQLVDDGLNVFDVVQGGVGQTARAYFHLASGLEPAMRSHSVVAGPVELRFMSGVGRMTVVSPGEGELGWIARGHGVLESAACVIVDLDGGSLMTQIRPLG